jgi:hypothetical protein
LQLHLQLHCSPQSATSTEPTLPLIALVPQAVQRMPDPAVAAAGPNQFQMHTAGREHAGSFQVGAVAPLLL